MTDQQLIEAYRKAYSAPNLEGIRGDIRTPDSSNVLGTNVTPAEALELLLKWGKIQ